MMLSRRSETVPVDSELVLTFVSEKTLNQYFQVAIVTILVYDTINTMDKEVKYFWKPPRSVVNILYFLNRYVGILGAVVGLLWNTYRVNISIIIGRRCNFAQWTSNVSDWITLGSVGYILTIRVLALCAQNKSLSKFLKTLLAAQVACNLGTMIYITVALDVIVGSIGDHETTCAYRNQVSWQFGMINWLALMAYEVILVSIALYKATEYWRLSSGFKGLALVRIVVQDQLLYFSLAIACSVVNIIEYELSVPNPFLADVLTTLGNPSFLCILGSRMLINLKEAGEQSRNQGTSLKIESVSEMRFA